MYGAAFVYMWMLTHTVCSGFHWKGMETAIPQHPFLQNMTSKDQFSLEEMMDYRAILAKVETKNQAFKKMLACVC